MNHRLEAFLSEIADFSNVGRRSSEVSPMANPRFGANDSIDELDLNNNAKLIAQFKTMRQKIKLLSKENAQYKLNEATLQKQVDAKYKGQLVSLQEKDAQNMAALNFLRREMDQINNGIDQLKSRNQELQDQVNRKQSAELELQYLQNTLIQIKQNNEELKRENDKLTEIGIMEKIELEDKIKALQLTKQVDKQYVQQLEIELSKAREKAMQAESKLRKLQNDMDETRYDRERLAQSSIKSQDLQSIISELTKERNKLKSALAQQKQKRLKAESKTMEKQQFSSLYTIQIETLEREVSQLKKKNKKWATKCEEKDSKAEQEAYKNIESKSKLYRSLQLFQECIGRIKRQMNMTGQLLQFVKSCQFKVSKLKDEDEQPKMRLSISHSKSKSKSRMSKASIKNEVSPFKSRNKVKTAKQENSDEEIPRSKQRKKSEEDEIMSSPNFSYSKVRKNSHRIQQTSFNDNFTDEPTKPLKKEDLDILRPIVNVQQKEQDVLEKKVKRDRELKQRKIRESLLYKKLDICNNEKDRMAIREEIVKLG